MLVSDRDTGANEENMWGPGDLAKAIAAGASDCIMLDVMKIGVTEWLNATVLAESHGLRVSSHLFQKSARNFFYCRCRFGNNPGRP